jgi:4-amino-4-deoxy-L-arabinose transferase-like glycosyltransferase
MGTETNCQCKSKCGNNKRIKHLESASSQRGFLVIIFVLALAVRVGYNLVFSNPNLPYNYENSDAISYDNIAWNLAHGRGYSIDWNLFQGYEYKAEAVHPTAIRAPLFPLLLASTYVVFGHNWFIARLLLSVLSASTVLLIFILGQRLFAARIGATAAIVSVFYPAFVEYTGSLLTETVYMLLLALAVLCLISEKPRSLSSVVVGGLIFGLIALTRPEGLLFIPFVTLWILRQRGGLAGFKTAALFLAVTLLVYSPWVMRNYLVFKEFILATTGGGMVMWGAHNPQTFTDYRLMGGWIYAPNLPHWEEIRDLPEVDLDKTLWRLALNAIRNHLRLMPKLELYKLYRLFLEGGALRDAINLTVLYFFAFGLALSIAERRPLTLLYLLFLAVIANTLIFYDLLWDAPVPLGYRALYTAYSQLRILGASSRAEGQKS